MENIVDKEQVSRWMNRNGIKLNAIKKIDTDGISIKGIHFRKLVSRYSEYAVSGKMI